MGTVPQCALTSGGQRLERGREQVDAQQLLERARRRLQRLVVTHRAAAAVVWQWQWQWGGCCCQGWMRWPLGDVARQEVARGVKSRYNAKFLTKKEIVFFVGTLGRTAGQQIALAFIHTHAHKRTTLRETTGMVMRGGYLLAGDDAHALSALWLGVGVGWSLGLVSASRLYSLSSEVQSVRLSRSSCVMRVEG